MTTDTTQRLLQPHPDLPLTLTEVGDGRPVLVLHGGGGPATVTGIVDHFTANPRVFAPTHPGWEGTPRPDWFSGVDDLAITYLDLLEDHDLRDVLVLGSSFGGWVASEMAVRDRGHRISPLVLLDAIGPEIPGHEVRMPDSGGPGHHPGDHTGQDAERPSPQRVGPPRSAVEAMPA
ncbi:alpha/beta fold hydrolase [Streptomyces inhibens]|uniref:alpha/beta fold hydrolase n=1 Tax=Streptomyces inhibens TaxID=2293571 RepID=UPI001EE6E509|nr:alpha/beta hydrolase [Streptomyces inhibens]UKY54475.1 alpha/beta hydrolase [Streptomyces inhibens]